MTILTQSTTYKHTVQPQPASRSIREHDCHTMCLDSLKLKR